MNYIFLIGWTCTHLLITPQRGYICKKYRCELNVYHGINVLSTEELNPLICVLKEKSRNEEVQ